MAQVPGRQPSLLHETQRLPIVLRVNVAFSPLSLMTSARSGRVQGLVLFNSLVTLSLFAASTAAYFAFLAAVFSTVNPSDLSVVKFAASASSASVGCEDGSGLTDLEKVFAFSVASLSKLLTSSADPHLSAAALNSAAQCLRSASR